MRRLFILAVVVVALFQANIARGEQQATPPTEYECRPYIEKALADRGTVETPADGEPIVEDEEGEGGRQRRSLPDDEGEGEGEESSMEMMQADQPASPDAEVPAPEGSSGEQVEGAEDKDQSPEGVSSEESAEGTQSAEQVSSDATGETVEGENAEHSAEESTESVEGEALQQSVEGGESTEQVAEGEEEHASVESTEETTEAAGAESVEGESTEQLNDESGEQAVEGGASDEQATEGGESLEQADEPAASSEQADEEGQSDEQSTEGGESTEPAAAGEESSEKSGEGAESSEQSAEGAESSEQAAEGVESSEQSAEGSESSEQSTEGAESSEPAAVEAETSEQSTEGAESTEQATESESAEQSAEGGESTEQASEGSESSEQSNETGESTEQAADATETSEQAAEGDSTETIGGETAQESVEGDSAEQAVEGEVTAESIEGDSAEAAVEEVVAEAAVEGEAAESSEAASAEVTVESEPTGEQEATAESTESTESGEPTETDAVTGDEIAVVEEVIVTVVADEEDAEPLPEEELSFDIEIPDNLRPRDHIASILRLDEESIDEEVMMSKVVETTLKDLKKFYDNAIKPLEILYKYRDLSNRHFGDPEIFSKPLILFMGPWSGGKSSIINYLLDNEYKTSSLRTGAEPSPAYFNIVMWGEKEEVLDGTQLAADWTFSGLQKFGQGLLDRLRGLRLNNRLLEKVNIVEIPGILEIRKQVQRMFPFNDACQWFIDRADIIFLVYDPSKLDVGPETEAILDQLKGREYQTRILLNKADQVHPEELMRVQGTLIWNISPLMSSTQPPVMYTTSLWSNPYELGAPLRLLRAQERAFLKDMREAIDKRVDNKIASARRFAVRVRNHAKMVDCYLTTYYNHKSFFGNRKKVADDIIEKPQDYHIYEGLSTLTNISRYDLPDPETYRDFFKVNPLYDFQLLSATCTYFKGCPINRLDIAIAYELPELLGKYKKAADAAVTKQEPEGKS